MVRSIEGGSIDIGELVSDTTTGKRAEIDVRLVKERQVMIYECKGHQPTHVIAKDEIEEWLTKRVPIVAKVHRQQDRFSGSTLRFEFWTCGTFDATATAFMRETKSRTRKYEIAWKDGAAVREYAKQIKAPSIFKMLNEHYFEHPLADLSDAALPQLSDQGARPTEVGKLSKSVQVKELDDVENLEVGSTDVTSVVSSHTAAKPPASADNRAR